MVKRSLWQRLTAGLGDTYVDLSTGTAYIVPLRSWVTAAARARP
jgi:hypothetical protein